ncbi:hypothetical protein ABZ897_23090 [Nonomuraea sp. NPDC046802]|uniref:hypothetical protein n=1 Tax=Nonomuraea sp. NPDC046802 TaxID=3154919 RepID=UPI00340ABE79
MNTTNRLARISFTAGPAALLCGWLLMGPVSGEAMPSPWWVAANAAWLAGFLMLGVMTVALRGMARPVSGGRRVVVDTAAGIALLSLAANVAQCAIAVYAAFTASGADGMRTLLDQVRGYPGVEVSLYTAGPQLVYPALVTLAVMLAVLGRVTVVSVAVTAAGVVVLMAGMAQAGQDSALAGVGIALMWLGMLLLGRGTSSSPRNPGLGLPGSVVNPR